MPDPQPLAAACSENFAVSDGYVYFQAGDNGPLHRVPCQGSNHDNLFGAEMYPSAGHLVVPKDGWVYFQAGETGLYRIPYNGIAKDAQPLHKFRIGHLAVPGDGYVYFQDQGHGICRVPCTGGNFDTLASQGLSEGALVVHDNYVYYRGTGGDLRRVRCTPGEDSKQLYDSKTVGHLAVDGGFVYFQTGDGLYRVPCDGKTADAKQLYTSAGYLAIRDNWVYFQGDGLRRVPCAGGTSEQLDANAGHLVVPGDGFVYFQSSGHGLYRVLCNGKINTAQQLDDRCGNLAIPNPFDGFVYYQGGGGNKALLRTPMQAKCAAAAGVRVFIQDEYVVSTLEKGDIDQKFSAITRLFNLAAADTSDTWFINFTSGASLLAYPDGVAGRINGQTHAAVNAFTPANNRLGTIVMDFPDDNGNTSYIDDVIKLNSTSPLSAANWMRDLKNADNTAKTRKLSRLTIPGTHDSCTFNASHISKCQNLTLPRQLAAGIRFIDIRCRHYKDKFELHHGLEYLNLNFNYVLDTCRDFLGQHPEECILMSVSREYESDANTTSFDQVFTQYVDAYEKQLTWYRGNTVPELDAVKGKVVLMRRFYIGAGQDCTKWGIDLTHWPENTTFIWP